MTSNCANAYYGWQTNAPSFYAQEFWIDPGQRELLIEVDSEPGVDEVIHLLVQDPITEDWLPMLTNDDYASAITPRCQEGLDRSASGFFLATSRIHFFNRFTEKKITFDSTCKKSFDTGFLDRKRFQNHGRLHL